MQVYSPAQGRGPELRLGVMGRAKSTKSKNTADEEQRERFKYLQIGY